MPNLIETPLAKECDCTPAVHGDIPHWVHMDRLWHAQNQALLERARLNEDINGCFGFLREEEARLETLAIELERRGLERIKERRGVWYGYTRERLEVRMTSYQLAGAGA